MSESGAPPVPSGNDLQVLPLGTAGRILLRNWLLLLFGVVLGGGAGYGLAQLVPPTYSATAIQLVKGIPGSGAAANYEAAQFAVSRARSYPSFIYSQDVLNGVAVDLGTTDLEDLRKTLSARNPPDTPLVEIVATARSAELAQRKANAAAARMATFITKIETVDEKTPVTVETAVEALLPEEPSDPRPMLYGAVGTAGGLALAVLIAVIRYFSRQQGWGGLLWERRRPRSRRPEPEPEPESEPEPEPEPEPESSPECAPADIEPAAAAATTNPAATEPALPEPAPDTPTPEPAGTDRAAATAPAVGNNGRRPHAPAHAIEPLPLSPAEAGTEAEDGGPVATKRPPTRRPRHHSAARPAPNNP